MDDSKDNKRDNTSNDWTNNPFERVNHSTNFEDYAITTETNLYGHQSDDNISSKVNEMIKKDPMSNTFSKIYLKPHKFEPKMSTDQTLDSGLSSTEVTPSGTPQNSPYSIRKMLETNKIGNNANTGNNNTTNQKLSTNSKRWFYTGFFGSDDKTGVSAVPKNPSLKNLCISNFDINAVGPTSW